MVLFFWPVSTDIRKCTASFEASQTAPALPSDKCSPEVKVSSEHLWNDAERRKRKYSEKTPSQYPLSTTNLTWPSLASKPVFRVNRLATNDLIHDTAFETAGGGGE